MVFTTNPWHFEKVNSPVGWSPNWRGEVLAHADFFSPKQRKHLQVGQRLEGVKFVEDPPRK